MCINTVTMIKKILDLYSKEFVHSKNEDILDLSIVRDGQDVRYSVDDTKLQALGWKTECNFDDELPEIVKFYKDNFIW